MINSVKARTPILALILFVFGAGYTFAANRVVVIPMAADSAPATTAFYAGANQYTTLTTTALVVRELAVTTSGQGKILVNVSGDFSLFTTTSKVNCSLRDDDTLSIDETAIIVALNSTFVPFAATRGFSVSEAGVTQISLLCKRNTPADGAAVVDTQMTAMFIPD